MDTTNGFICAECSREIMAGELFHSGLQAAYCPECWEDMPEDERQRIVAETPSEFKGQNTR